MNKTEYSANLRKEREHVKRKSLFEEHHLLGKINSDKTIDLPRTWHDFITHSQNSIPPKYRTNKDILALSSLIGLNDLISEQMRIFREIKLKELEGVRNG